MTREEAITYLNVIWNRYKAEYEIERETLDAYHMAIEALHREEAEEKGYCHRIRPSNVEVVVRCKDCKHRDEKCGMGEHRWCGILKMSTMPNDFCSYAERKRR